MLRPKTVFFRSFLPGSAPIITSNQRCKSQDLLLLSHRDSRQAYIRDVLRSISASCKCGATFQGKLTWKCKVSARI